VAYFVDYDCVVDSLLGYVVAAGGDFSCCYFGCWIIFCERVDLASMNCVQRRECPKSVQKSLSL
jgi:hypothetical protein